MKRFSFIHTLTHSNFLPTANAVPMPRVFNFSYFFLSVRVRWTDNLIQVSKR